MAEIQVDKERLCYEFSQLHWHDSQLLDFSVLKRPREKKYDFRLSLNLIKAYGQGTVEKSTKSAVFKDCRILQLDLDLLGLLMCGGAIGSAECYEDAIDFERKRRNKQLQFDLPQVYNPLEDCLAFHIEMIHPGGEILIFAREFELI